MGASRFAEAAALGRQLKYSVTKKEQKQKTLGFLFCLRPHREATKQKEPQGIFGFVYFFGVRRRPEDDWLSFLIFVSSRQRH